MAGFDIREKGSGNAGTTNMLRAVGKKAAVITLICDILKGVVSILIAVLAGKIIKNLDNALLVQLAGIFVIIGHTFPVFFKFKGGKGIATALGVNENGISWFYCSSYIISNIGCIYRPKLYCSN